MSRKKVLVLLIDGIGDISYSTTTTTTSLNHPSTSLTPLQLADTPTLDKCASNGWIGLMDPVEPGLACGSDTAHMSLFGYDPRIWYRGRGAFESLGAGLQMGVGDIGFKCNFACLSPTSPPELPVVAKRRADREFEREGELLCREVLDGMSVDISDSDSSDECEHSIRRTYSVHAKYATEHRCGLIVRGYGLSDCISGTDPLKDNLPLLKCEPVLLSDSSRALANAAKRTCKVINKLSNQIHQRLKSHPLQLERRKEGKLDVDIVLFRGCGIRLDLPSIHQSHPWLFNSHAGNVTPSKSFAIAPTCMINGWMQSIGVDLIVGKRTDKLTGDYHSRLDLKFKLALKLLLHPHQPYNLGQSNSSYLDDTELNMLLDPNIQDGSYNPARDQYSFGFLHIKGVDDAGHDKLLDMKIKLIEIIDKCLADFIQEYIRIQSSGTGGEPEESLYLVVTGDHSTPVAYGDHSCEPVPFLICKVSPDILIDGDSQVGFNEIDCAGGELGRFGGMQMFPIIQQFIDR